MKFDVNTPTTFPRRQVHLDFHTSPAITGIGSEFSKENFQKELQNGHVNSITVFAKCHHGVCYYPTEVGIRHPQLSFDLLGAQMEAAHEIGVRVPVYITAGWSDEDAKAHPEWIARNKDGSMSTTGTFDPSALQEQSKGECAWIDMCLNDGSYCEHIYQLTHEICSRYKTLDGLFYDICFVGGPCYCEECKAGMIAAGLNPEKEEDAWQYYREKHISFLKKCKEILDQYHPGATIFFNSGGADMYKPEYHPYSTHFEMEDLPTAWGGYDKMPLNAGFFSGTGKYYLGMTGKFHLSWGEFGGFKCKEALKYEVATMAVYGAGCSIGDHLYPDGVMDPQTYENIGYAYGYLERIEGYCYNGQSTASVGVYLSESKEANSGVSKILLENQVDYRIVKDGQFEGFDVVIFPGKVVLDDVKQAALQEYIEKGGKVLFVGEALIKDGEFQIDCGLTEPVTPQGDGDYILVSHQLKESLEKELPGTPFYSYFPAVRSKAAEDVQLFAEMLPPCFNRTYAHFCGHKNSPYLKNTERFPALVKKGNVVYLAHRIPEIYDTYGSLYHKRYFMAALQLLSPKLPLQIDIGAQGRCRMIYQEAEGRYCINMTYASPVRRGAAEIIEDITPLYNIPITVTLPKEVVSVELPLQGKEISFSKEWHADGEQGSYTYQFILEQLLCHETILIYVRQ